MRVKADTDAIRQALQCGQPGCACSKPAGLLHCPAHQDHAPSLSLSEKDGNILVYCHAGCPKQAVISALRDKNLWPSSRNGDGADTLNVKAHIVAIYDYLDAKGNLLFQVCRLKPKTFRQRQPDGKGSWVWKMGGVKLVPYHLPELHKADHIFICEGEKDTDSLTRLGLTATCNPMGAGKWRKTYNEHFHGKCVTILPDNDNPGRKHAQDVARNLHGVAGSVKVVELPGLPEKGDVSDWIKAGGTAEQLQALAEAAPEWNPGPEDVPSQDDEDKKLTQAEMLIALAADAVLFHDLNRKAYTTIPVDNHLETWPIKGMAFRDWLRGRFYKIHRKPPGGQALQDALDLLAAQARFDGKKQDIFVRVAHVDGKIYVDLANESWQAVEISSQGWKVVDRPPVKFRRPRGLAPLPSPKPGGNIDDLKPFINCEKDDWPLIVAWLIGAFSSGPYPAMIFQGEQGTAKTTTARTLKSLVDPGHTPQRTAPRDIRDLMIFAANSWCLSFDNLSDLRNWLLDGFCRLATGGGLSTRELYSDSDETILDAIRPVILNGIDSLVSRADLADRAILLELPRIEDSYRQRETDFWREFEAAQPGILGTIFDCLSMALANVNKVKLARLPRMADFATWVVAAEPALPWEPGTFLESYTRNRAAVVEHSLEGDCVAVAVKAFMAHRQKWEGTASALLEELTEVAGLLVSKGKSWPKAPNVLSNRIRRAAPFLSESGIEFETGWGEIKGRKLVFRKHEKKIVGTVGTVVTDEYQQVIPHGLKTSHNTHDPQNESRDRKANDDAGSHDNHNTHDEKAFISKTDANQALGEVEL